MLETGRNVKCHQFICFDDLNLSELLCNHLGSEQTIKHRIIYVLKDTNTILVVFQIVIQLQSYAKYVCPIPTPSLNLTCIFILVEEMNTKPKTHFTESLAL